MLKNKQIDYQKLDELFKQTELLVAHNVSFDKKFVKKEINSLNNKIWLCSMNGIRWYKKGFNSKGLQYLLKAHDIDPEQAHRSESDVMGLIKLFNCKASSNETYFMNLLRNYNIERKDIDF
jgi:DNA polymerase-3 subunit epsilon